MSAFATKTVSCLRTIFALALVAAIPAHAWELAPPGTNEHEQSEAGVRATEDHWSLAEVTGQTEWLESMLMPGYRSVDNGVAHSKERIVAGAAKNKGSTDGKAKLDAYRKEHPSGTSVVVHGNIAVVSFYDLSLGPDNGVKSSDVFLYEGGAWHAAYSQHGTVGKE
ncbi:nuclear transport factor 2 family protein [Pinirhizobacter soli]|uniref:nuclear transport factor 2 family protein n=1 Tax=Pinirhizobacter soli TaxID=2786953 RepID=UPI00202A4BFE|nr:nuclear transport factor 2 family protein [Pinirhizobacter soli]